MPYGTTNQYLYDQGCCGCGRCSSCCSCCPWWVWLILALLLFGGVIGGLIKVFTGKSKKHGKKHSGKTVTR
jgi:H+/Cl- antiporter ClcA